MASDKTGICSICGKEIAISGLKNHEKACARKQGVNIEEDTDMLNENEEVLAPEDGLEVAEDAVVEPESELEINPQPKIKLVRVRMNDNLECSIGGINYQFEKDGEYEVPENVKRILLNAGYLGAI